jgi:hypothetical protein
MRRWVLAFALVAGACSETPSNDGPEPGQVTHEAGPSIGATLVPGVSLSYEYGFRLPVERLASVQEEHAAQCEALTPAKCRITGMTYDVGRNRTITASLQLKLAPEIARRFGKQGVDTVAKRGGMLVSARIDSEETGAQISAIDRDTASLRAERERLQAQLAKPGLPSAERTQIQARLAALSDAQRQTDASRSEAEQKLASTPMTFSYMSGDVDPGLSDGPILGAIKDGWANIISGFAIILTLLITLLPWLATAALAVLLWRRFHPKLGGDSERE